MIIRAAIAADAATLAEIVMMAGHGIMTMLYEGLVPGRTVAQTIVDRRLLNPRSFCALHLWYVAEGEHRTILGAINCLPQRVLVTAESDPLLTEERVAAVAELSELEEFAVDTYYINMIAVFPEHRRSGVGRALMAEAERLARQAGIMRLSLCTYDADAGLMAFYGSLGLVPLERRLIKPNPFFDSSGNWVLLARDLAS